LTLSSEDSIHETPQSGQGSGRDNNTDTSHRDQGGGGGTGSRDRPVAVDGSSSKKHAT